MGHNNDWFIQYIKQYSIIIDMYNKYWITMLHILYSNRYGEIINCMGGHLLISTVKYMG